MVSNTTRVLEDMLAEADCLKKDMDLCLQYAQSSNCAGLIAMCSNEDKYRNTVEILLSCLLLHGFHPAGTQPRENRHAEDMNPRTFKQIASCVGEDENDTNELASIDRILDSSTEAETLPADIKQEATDNSTESDEAAEPLTRCDVVLKQLKKQLSLKPLQPPKAPVLISLTGQSRLTSLTSECSKVKDSSTPEYPSLAPVLISSSTVKTSTQNTIIPQSPQLLDMYNMATKRYPPSTMTSLYGQPKSDGDTLNPLATIKIEDHGKTSYLPPTPQMPALLPFNQNMGERATADTKENVRPNGGEMRLNESSIRRREIAAITELEFSKQPAYTVCFLSRNTLNTAIATINELIARTEKERFSQSQLEQLLGMNSDQVLLALIKLSRLNFADNGYQVCL